MPVPTRTATAERALPFEEAARLTKAWRIVFALERAGLTADDLPDSPGPLWRLAAEAAGVRAPSAKTCVLARGLLRHRQLEAAV